MKEDQEWNRSEWGGRSKNQVRTNAQISGCLVVLFTAGLMWFGILKLVIFLKWSLW